MFFGFHQKTGALLLPTVLLLCYCPLFCYFVTAHCFVTLLLPTVLLLCYCPLFCYFVTAHCFVTLLLPTVLGQIKEVYYHNEKS